MGWGPGHTWEPGHAQNVAWLWYHGLRYPPGKRVNRHLRHRSLVDWLDVPDLPGLPPCCAADEMGVVDRFVASLVGAPLTAADRASHGAIEGLGRDAPAAKARAAPERILLDHGGLEAQLPGPLPTITTS